MAGLGGKPAWAWIFIIEGLVTVVAGVASFWIIVDFPDNATFLSEAERTVVIRRLQGDAQFSAAGEKMSWRHIRKALTEWKTYLCSKFTLIPQPTSLTSHFLVIVYAGADMPLYAFALFLPSIISEVSSSFFSFFFTYMC
jgi:hypothetical protein